MKKFWNSIYISQSKLNQLIQLNHLKTSNFTRNFLPSLDVIQYPGEYVSILHIQKLYQVYLACISKLSYLGLLQIDLSIS